MLERVRERLQPSLIERLTDDAPEQRREAPGAHQASLTQLRASVLRNLASLFNAVTHDADRRLDAWPEVRRSALNFGLPALAGRVASTIELRTLERELRLAVLRFEPRLLADSVRVSVLDAERGAFGHNVIAFRVEAQLWAQPAPVAFSLHTRLDLESGQCTVAEGHAGRAAP
jgi:type VI secretion system protein ImpF